MIRSSYTMRVELARAQKLNPGFVPFLRESFGVPVAMQVIE